MPHPQDGPYQLTINYVVTISGRALPHVHTLDVNIINPPSVGDDFGAIDCETPTSTPISLDAGVAAYMTPFLLQYAASCVVGLVELHLLTPGLPPQWIAATDSYVGQTGTGGGSNAAAGQNTWSWRTLGGNVMKFQLMETNVQDNVKSTTMPTADQTALRNYILNAGNDMIFVGRDGTPPIALMSLARTQNEKLARKRFRST